MASRHENIFTESNVTALNTSSRQLEQFSLNQTNNGSLQGQNSRLDMYRDGAEDGGDEDPGNSHVFGYNIPSTMHFAPGPGESDIGMYQASQAATSNYYGLPGQNGGFNGNGSMSSASALSTAGNSSTGGMGSRSAQFAGNRIAHSGASASTPASVLNTQNSMPVLGMPGSGSLSGRGNILSPASTSIGQQSPFSFSSSGTPGTIAASNSKLSRSLSASASTQATGSSGFSGQMRLSRNGAPTSGYENRPFVSQHSQPTALEPQSLDMSDFPAISRTNNRRPQSQSATTPGMAPGTSQLPPRNYGIVSKPREQEFTMVSEDFPALPSSGPFKSGMPDMGDGKLSQSLFPLGISSSTGLGGMGLSSGLGGDNYRITGSIPVDTSHQESHSRSSNVGVIGQRPAKGTYQGVEQASQPGALAYPQRSGIQTTADGLISNIPSSMVKDQYGLIGLLTFIRVAENEPNLVSLALGLDLTTLGLNLQSPDMLCHSFTSPYAEGPARPQDIDYFVPEEYHTHTAIREKLAPIKLHRYGEDLLFFLYYHRYVTSTGHICYSRVFLCVGPC